MSSRITIAVFLLQLFTCPSIVAQHYYPGGLGNANLLLWLDANKGSSVTQNGSNQVSQWADLSGNGYNFQQNTTANKPVFSATGGPNGKPALTFNASNRPDRFSGHPRKRYWSVAMVGFRRVQSCGI